MAIPLRYSTASQEISLGPFLDETDGITQETGLTINAVDIAMWKTGATSLANKNSGGATHMASGRYYAVLDATDTNTLGPMVIFVHVSGALPVRHETIVYPAVVYDAMFMGTDTLQVDVTQIGGVAQSATDLKDFADEGYDPSTNKVQGVVLADTVTTLTGHTAQTGDSFARIGAAGAGLTAVGGLSAAGIDAILDEVVEGAITMRQCQRAILALISKVSGAPTGPIIFRDSGDTKDRLSFTVDADGNRSSVTIDLT